MRSCSPISLTLTLTFLSLFPAGEASANSVQLGLRVTAMPLFISDDLDDLVQRSASPIVEPGAPIDDIVRSLTVSLTVSPVSTLGAFPFGESLEKPFLFEAGLPTTLLDLTSYAGQLADLALWCFGSSSGGLSISPSGPSGLTGLTLWGRF